jgi:hypothetical protein
MPGELRNLPISYNNVCSNVAGNFEDMQYWTGESGNLSVEPLSTDTIVFKPESDSLLSNIGRHEFIDREGSPADIGPWGGQSAPRE